MPQSNRALEVSRDGLALVIVGLVVAILFIVALFYLNSVGDRIVRLQQALDGLQFRVAYLEERVTELESHPELTLFKVILDWLLRRPAT